MLTLSNPVWLEQPESACSASLMQSVFRVDTDWSALSAVKIYFRVQAWHSPDALLSDIPNRPAMPAFVFQLTPDTPLDTVLPMTAPLALSFMKVSLMVKSTATTLQLIFTVRFWLGADMLLSGYENLSPAFWEAFTLQKSNDRTRLSVFDEVKSLRVSLHAVEPDGATAYISSESEPVKHRFWENATLTDLMFILKRNDIAVKNLSALANTEIKFGITSSDEVTEAYAFLMRVNKSNGDSLPFTPSLELSYIKAESVFTTDFSDWGLSSEAFLPTAESDLQTAEDAPTYFSAIVKSEVLTSGGSYRFGVIWQTADGVRSAFLSPVFRADAVPDLVPPEISGSLTDFTGTYGNAIRACPLERIESKIIIPTAEYDASRERTFLQAITDVQLSWYVWDQDLGLTHVLQRELWRKAPDGTWNIDSEGEENSVSLGSGSIIFRKTFRIRNEPSVKNLFSYREQENQPLPVPLGNQDWSGKTVFLEYRFRLQHTAPEPFEDILIFTQRIDVLPFEDSINADLKTPFQLPLRQWLASYESLTMNISAENDAPEAYLLFLQDPATGILHEADSTEGLLPKRSSPLLAPQEETLNDRATVRLNAKNFATGVSYPVTVVRKGLIEEV